MERPVKFIYFASVRDRIGTDTETLAMPDNLATGADVIAWLRARGENYDYALADDHRIRIAVDQRHIEPGAAIGQAAEIALFPPMTGG